MTAVRVFKSFARRCLHRLAPWAYRRPWLVKLAGGALTSFPSVKARLRRALASVPAAVTPANLNDAQLRVLLDLRDAVADQIHTGDDSK